MQVTDETFQQEVLASETPVLVDFYADWCGPCRAAAPVIEALAEEYAGKIKVVKVDVDTSSKNAVEHGVRGIPNFIVFKGGQRVAQFIGWGENRAEEIRAALETALASN
jgi:thioredoxin 1